MGEKYNVWRMNCSSACISECDYSSQEHVCSLLMQFTGCTHSQQKHNCRGPGNNSASQIRDTNTCTQKHAPCPSVTHTHRQKHTTESLFKKETLVTSLTSLRERAPGQKCISWPLCYSYAICSLSAGPDSQDGTGDGSVTITAVYSDGSRQRCPWMSQKDKHITFSGG